MEAATLTPAQRRAMTKEINAQILKSDIAYKLDMDAAVLFVLHDTFGFGKKRLWRFFHNFTARHQELREFYQLDDENNTWICRRLLKERMGVDVEAWEKEFTEHGQSHGQSSDNY